MSGVFHFLIPLCGGLLIACSGADPSPSPSTEPSPTSTVQTGTLTQSSTVTPPGSTAQPGTQTPTSASPTVLSTPSMGTLEVQVMGSDGLPWSDAMVFTGSDGQGPVATTNDDGFALLEGVQSPTTLSVYFNFSLPYSESDSYTVNRIISYVDVSHEGTWFIELERPEPWAAPGDSLGWSTGSVHGIDDRIEASRVYVTDGSSGFSGPPDTNFVFAFEYTQPQGFLYGSQVASTGNGDYALESIPLAYALELDPPTGGLDLSLDKSFSDGVDVQLSGRDPLINAMSYELLWTLPDSRGQLEFKSESESANWFDSHVMALPEPLAVEGADNLAMVVYADGSNLLQSLVFDDVVRGQSLESSFYPVPRVITHLPLSTKTLPGAQVDVSDHVGSEKTTFHFAERWYRIGGGGYVLWYDLWTVEGAEDLPSMVVPVKPDEIPWPGELGAVWTLLDRFSYVRADYSDGQSLRELETAPADL